MQRVAVRILVVDDDVSTLKVLQSILGAEGFAVEVSKTPGHALALVGEAPFDILLTDLVMADMDGLELVEAARRVQPELRCCVMSGHSRGGDIPAHVRWIDKPLDVDLVLDVLGLP